VRKRLQFKRLALLCVLNYGTSAEANLLVEHSFRQKLADSDIVLVGTVTATSPSHRDRLDGTVRVRTLTALKGTPAPDLVVRTQSLIAEDNPDCCEVGATYIMFLRYPPDGTPLTSVNGRFGIIRIGPARNDPEIQVVNPPG
jgi:hypothetical protein